LFDRPKSGFAIPIDRWLRRELRDWAEALLDPARLRQEGYLAPAAVARRWRQHQKGEMNWAEHLWGVLMFQAWLEELRRDQSEEVVAPAHPGRVPPGALLPRSSEPVRGPI
jgi:asparagine synthase (glutamine-hydrolysing)